MPITESTTMLQLLINQGASGEGYSWDAKQPPIWISTLTIWIFSQPNSRHLELPVTYSISADSSAINESLMSELLPNCNYSVTGVVI